jgi:DNA-binding SARP family transcriptional activator
MTGLSGTRFGLLGPLEIRVGGEPLPALRPRQRAIAARLLLSANRYVATDQLIDDIWAGAEPVTARSQIQTDLAIVRRAIRAAGGHDPITTKSQGYLLSTGDLDLADFRSGLARSESAASLAAARSLVADALGLWRGEALADVVAPYVTRMREQIDEERLSANERLFDIELELGRHAESIAPLIELVTTHPLRQRFCAQLMLALHRSGRSAEALRAGRQSRARLAELHGLDPDWEIVMLERAILAEDPSLDYLPPAVDVSAKAAPVAAQAVPAQLPPLVASMVGRKAELDRMSEALTETDGPHSPVCVLAGVGGVGKTTLAVAWAHHRRHLYPDGQLYVDLRGYGARPVPVLAAILQCLRALGVPNDRLPMEEAEAAAALRTRLDGRRVLLVIDNARGAEQVRSLLPAGPGCAAIVTSRHHLGGLAARDGATLMEVAPLPQEDALALMVAMLGEQRVDAEPDALGRLAEAAGYLPLALRILAARAIVDPGLGLAGIAGQVTEDRMGSLAVDGDSGASVLMAFEPSYTMLQPYAQKLFRLFGILPGADFTAETLAEATGGRPAEARDAIAELVEGHLVEGVAAGRFAMHDLVREYARSLAESVDGAQRCRAAAALVLRRNLRRCRAANAILSPFSIRLPAEQAEAGDGFAEVEEAVRWLESEHANLVAAVPAAADIGEAELAVSLADALRGYLYRGSHVHDLLTIGSVALAAAGSVPVERRPWLRASARLTLSQAMFISGDTDATAVCEAGLADAEQAGWRLAAGAFRSNLGMQRGRVGDSDAAVRLLSEAVLEARAEGHVLLEANSLGNLAGQRWGRGELAEAEAAYRALVPLFQQVGSRDGEAHALLNLGGVSRLLGQLEVARETA